MDYLPHFHREVAAFERAARTAAEAEDAPPVPSCPAWTVSDLVEHLGVVHRTLVHVIDNRLLQPPDGSDRGYLRLPEDREGWPEPLRGPAYGRVPTSLVDWFAEGAALLESAFRSNDPDLAVWTWWHEQNVGFWARMQTIEAAVHRWDAESAVGTPSPVDGKLAADAVAQTFEVMGPARRIWTNAPAGEGERFGFSRSDGPESWTVCFDGREMRSSDGVESADVELAGTASDLMLFLWRRIPAERLDIAGDRNVLARYFTLVPPV